jgi:alpha-beta hydrolase superfamily lysophospholipase
MRRIIGWIVKGVIGAALLVFTGLLAWAFQSRGMPDLEVWHTAALEAEFTAGDATLETTLADYLAFEDRLYQELHDEVSAKTEATGALIYSRYHEGGPQDPNWDTRDWNRTFELVPDAIIGGALLLHGLTDSPYSLRRVGELLHARGFYVLGLRLPGHGTIPAALTTIRWQDWVAASRVGARHVRSVIGAERPFVVAGYSNGGALAAKYALDALRDPSLTAPDRLILFSPEIGIAPAAAIANSHKLFSFMPYFAKFKWLSIQPEYDPFKYNSFPKNAAREAWAVTREVQAGVNETRASGRFKDFPNTLTFLSWTDATVDTAATVQTLYGQLENDESELVIFDVNRLAPLSPFVPASNRTPLLRLKDADDLPYRLTVITNTSDDSNQVARKSKPAHSNEIETTPLATAWPRGIYSLSHVAIPMAPDDPVYGTAAAPRGAYRGLPLGAIQSRGETRLLTVPLSQLLRLRHNPFFDYVERRINQEIDKVLE